MNLTFIFLCFYSDDIRPVDSSDVVKKSDVVPGRVGRRAKRQVSNQSHHGIMDGINLQII
jgi:hypothetical protein